MADHGGREATIPDRGSKEHGQSSGITLPHLDEAQQQDAERRSSPPVRVVWEAIRTEGEEELQRSSSALAWSGLAAGLSMGFSLVAEGLLHAFLPNESWRPLLSKFGYSFGFLIVILGRQQLFTENTLTVIIPLLAKFQLGTILAVLRLWAVVLTANLLGVLLFAWVLQSPKVFPEEVRKAFTEIGLEAIQGPFTALLLKGVFAGWLIALMVWLLPAAETNRFFVIILIAYIVGLAQLSHVIAGSVETLFVVLAHLATWTDYARYLVPTLLGNILGGVSLVAVLNHAQVVSGEKTEPEV